jgi:hypothetical protein
MWYICNKLKSTAETRRHGEMHAEHNKDFLCAFASLWLNSVYCDVTNTQDTEMRRKTNKEKFSFTYDMSSNRYWPYAVYDNPGTSPFLY